VDELQLLVNLHLPNDRQGPGGDAETRLALGLSGLLGRAGLKVADVGCGTGASTLVLAELLDAEITAVDIFSAFLDALERRAAERTLRGRIRPLAASMDALPFEPGSLDAIWSEGAIYNIGFEAGVKALAPFIKAGGVLAVSELTWLTAERPAELEAHWSAEYPEVGLASEKFAVLERNGFTPVGYFPLPSYCWTDNYYRPLEARLPAFLAAHDNSEEARAIADATLAESALYTRFQEHFSYGFYVARKAGG
jgi:SAM-dependent methyltransferase